MVDYKALFYHLVMLARTSIQKGMRTLILVLLLAACQASPDQRPSPESTGGMWTTPENPVATALPTPAPASTPGLSADPIFPIPNREHYQFRLIAEGFDRPTVLTHAADGSDRLFVAEKSGRIHIIKDGWVAVEPFLDISDKVITNENAGLLGLAFDPGYHENGFFYVYYVNREQNSVIARFSVSRQDTDRADPASEQLVLKIDEAQRGHYAGTLAFGPDGRFYIAVGDGGLENALLDPNPAQDTNLLTGKILRIDVSDGLPYSIPPDNLLIDQDGRDEIWGLGLRNPWGFAFDRLTGELFVVDPGQDAREEVNFIPSIEYHRRNFAWNFLEGSQEFLGPLPAAGSFVFPIHQYEHADGLCSVIGGQVYRGAAMPEWQGIYIFGDFCQGDIWGLVRNNDDSWTLEGLYRLGYPITAFGADQRGEIYVLGYNGEVSILVPRP